MFQVSSVIGLLSIPPNFVAMRVQSCVVPSPLCGGIVGYSNVDGKTRWFWSTFSAPLKPRCARAIVRGTFATLVQFVSFYCFVLLGVPVGTLGVPGCFPRHFWGRLWAPFGASLGIFGPLRASLGPLGGPLGSPGAPWGDFGEASGVSGRLRGSLGTSWVAFGEVWGLFGVPGCRTGRPRTPRDAPGSRQIAAGSTRERSRAPRDRPRPPETALSQSAVRAVQNAPGRF